MAETQSLSLSIHAGSSDLVGTLQIALRPAPDRQRGVSAAVAAAWQDAPPQVLFDDAARDAALTLPFDARHFRANEMIS